MRTIQTITVSVLSLFAISAHAQMDFSPLNLARQTYQQTALGYATELMTIHSILSETPVDEVKRDIALCEVAGSVKVDVITLFLQATTIAKIQNDTALLANVESQLIAVKDDLVEFQAYCDLTPAKAASYRNLAFFNEKITATTALVQKLTDTVSK